MRLFMNDLLFDNKHVDALFFSFAICYGFLRLLTGLIGKVITASLTNSNFRT